MSLYYRKNGYRDVLNIGLPLVVSMSSVTVMQVTDQIFLAQYSLDAVAAALPANLASFLFTAFFLGVAGYTNVFVAQYSGSKAGSRVGESLWQGIHFSLLASILLLGAAFLGRPIFDLSGHPSEIIELEVIYFEIMTAGSGLRVLSMTLSCFYSGRGLTRPVMIVNTVAAAINIPLDYALIYGFGPIPEMGITGAAIATITASGISVLLFGVLIFTRTNENSFSVWSGWRFDRELFSRMMKYGMPGGVQFFIDIFAFTCFLFFVGRIGKMELAAANIVFAINHLAFMPMIGLSVATSTLVGQAIGQGKPDDGVTATYSSIHIALIYMALLAALFVLVPEWLCSFFKPQDMSWEEFGQITSVCVILLRLVAAYCLGDALAIVYSGAIKGAGDTRFVMWSMTICALAVLIAPVYLGVEYLDWGLFPAFVNVLVYITVLAAIFWIRFKQGKWKSMRVIEHNPLAESNPA